MRLIDADAIAKDWSIYRGDIKFSLDDIMFAIENRPTIEELHDIIRAIGTITYGKERWFDNNDGTWYDRSECDNVPLSTVVDRLIREVSWLEEQYENAID